MAHGLAGESFRVPITRDPPMTEILFVIHGKLRDSTTGGVWSECYASVILEPEDSAARSFCHSASSLGQLAAGLHMDGADGGRGDEPAIRGETTEACILKQTKRRIIIINKT